MNNSVEELLLPEVKMKSFYPEKTGLKRFLYIFFHNWKIARMIIGGHWILTRPLEKKSTWLHVTAEAYQTWERGYLILAREKYE